MSRSRPARVALTVSMSLLALVALVGCGGDDGADGGSQDKPENLDDWTYRDGEWSSRPVSVSLSEIEALDDTTFQPSQVAWAAIPGLVQQALDGLDLEDEHIDAVSFDRIAGEPPRVYIGVTGLRGNGRLMANADGTEVEIARN